MKRTVLGVVVMAAIILSFSAPAQDEAQSPLSALLIDLDGWQAEKAQPMNMDMGGMKMSNASREYRNGENEFAAVISAGNQGMGAPADFQEMNMETDETKVSRKKIDGFDVTSTVQKKDKEGSIVVTVDQSEKSFVTLVVTFKGISEGDAMDLAKKFDWNKIKAVAAKLQ